MGLKAQNKELVIPNVGDTVEVRFRDSGTDSVVSPYVWYFNLEFNAKSIVVRVDQVAVITEINNIVLKSPVTIPANGSFTRNVNAFQKMEFHQIKIKIQTANTNVQVYGDA